MSTYGLIVVRTICTLAAVTLVALNCGWGLWQAASLALSVAVGLDAHVAIVRRGGYKAGLAR